jgi:hypothetical protein
MAKQIYKALLHFLDLRNGKGVSSNTAQLLEELDSLTQNKKVVIS